MIKIKNYKQGSPEWVMAKFFDCWKRRAWKQMLDYVQPSWLAIHKEPNKVLRLSLDKLIDIQFVQVNAKTGVIAIFQINIRTRFHSSDDIALKAVRLVREGKKWGVDPRNI